MKKYININILKTCVNKANQSGPFKYKIDCYKLVADLFYQTTNTKITHNTVQRYVSQYKWVINYQKLTTVEFIDKAKQIHGDKFNYSEVNYINQNTKIKLICNVCNRICITTPAIHLNGSKCRRCFNRSIQTMWPKPIKFFEDKCKEKHQNKYKYFQDYTTRRNKIKIQCLTCNNIFYKIAYKHLYGAGCPFCNMSQGAQRIFMYLQNHNIIFEYEKTFPTLKRVRRLKIDFYIPNYNLAIEFDGPQHTGKSIYYTLTSKEFAVIKERDRIKEQFLKNNNIELLRINDITQIETELNNIFCNRIL